MAGYEDYFIWGLFVGYVLGGAVMFSLMAGELQRYGHKERKDRPGAN